MKRRFFPVALLLMPLWPLFTGCSPESGEVGPMESYRLDDLFGDALSVEAGQPPAELEGLAFRFSDGAAAGWTGGLGECAVRDGALTTRLSPEAPLTSPDGLGIDAPEVDTIRVRARVDGADRFSLTWRARGGDWSELQRVINVYVTRPGEMVTYELQVSGVRAWRHRTVDQLRFQAETPADLAIESIQLLTRRDMFEGAPAGLREYEVNHRVRPCLYAFCPASIRYRVRIPEGGQFSAGLATIDPANPTMFSLTVTDGGTSQTLFERTMTKVADWDDVRVDLSAFGGRDVVLFLRAEAEAAGQVALWSSPVVFEPKPAPETGLFASKPAGGLNVVVYMVDCLRADHLSGFGYGRETAPFMAEFASTGAQFRRCFSQEPWTKPSMTSLATGVDTFTHGVERYGDMAPDDLVMLPEILRQAGYVTGAITENPHTPPDAAQRRAYCHLEPVHLQAEIGEPVLEWNELPEVTFGAARGFLETNRDRNFFLYVHTMEPHDIPVEHAPNALVYDPPAPFRDRWASPDNPHPMDRYDECIAFADANFRRFMAMLDELGLRKNTLVILAGDHGEAFGEHEGFFGHASKPYNELIHVPLLMSLPGVVPSRRIVEDNVRLIDVTPTILDYVGLAPVGQFQGLSLRPVLERNAGPDFAGRLVPSTWVGYHSAIQGDWKLFVDSHAGGARLFNIATDYAETRDLSAEYPDTAAALRQALEEHIARGRGIRAGFTAADATRMVNPEAQEQLKAMGYLGGNIPSAPTMPSAVPRTTPADPARHVLFIVIDALRADHLGCYGYERNTSPFIDSLAREGYVFNRAMSMSTFTCESVSAMFSGQLPSCNPRGQGWLATPNPDRPTLAEVFAGAGYMTGLFTDTPALKDTAFDRGFAETERVATEYGKSGLGGAVSERALEFLKAHRDTKTFNYIHYFDPHMPHNPPKERYLQFASEVFPNPVETYVELRMKLPDLLTAGFGPGEARFEDLVTRYDAEIADVDGAIERLFAGMKELGILEDTLVVITADHGEEFLDHGYVEHAWQLYRESVHVPLIFWAPAWFKPARVENVVSQINLMPTLLRLTATTHPGPDLRGEALFERAGDAITFLPPTRPAIAELLLETRCITRAVVSHGHKLISWQRYLTPEQCVESARTQDEQMKRLRSGELPPIDIWGPVVHEALYDMDGDFLERNPIADADTPERALLRAVLESLKNECGAAAASPAAARPRDEVDENVERLNAMGYLGGDTTNIEAPAPAP